LEFFSPPLEEKIKYHRVSCWPSYSINEPLFPLPCLLLELLLAKIFSIYVLASCVLGRDEKGNIIKMRKESKSEEVRGVCCEGES